MRHFAWLLAFRPGPARPAAASRDAPPLPPRSRRLRPWLATWWPEVVLWVLAAAAGAVCRSWPAWPFLGLLLAVAGGWTCVSLAWHRACTLPGPDVSRQGNT